MSQEIFLPSVNKEHAKNLVEPGIDKTKSLYEPVRLMKLEALRTLGINPYPDSYDVTHHAQEINEDIEVFESEKTPISIAGRLMAKRGHGKLIFGDLQDDTGKVQISMQLDILGQNEMELVINYYDVGDIIGIQGVPFRTQRGQPTVRAEHVTMLAKSLLPLPEKWHGVQNTELIQRERYLELIMSRKAKERFETRSRVIKAIRGMLDDAGFMEMETSVLQRQKSGANAASFITYHNILDTDFHLRIAPEVELKEYLVAGFEKVYEVAKVFRNEGIDPSHLQEFTMLEYYSAWWNAQKNMSFTQALFQNAVHAAYGENLVIQIGNQEIDFGGDWPVNDYRILLLEHSGIDLDQYPNAQSLLDIIKVSGILKEMELRGIDTNDLQKLGRGAIIDRLWKTTTRPYLIQPQFVVRYPKELSPLARPNDRDPQYVDQFQILVNGWELAKGYSELVDPQVQRQALEEQARLKEIGDEEAMPINEQYLKAMTYGMPPNSGVGIGIDRLVTFLTCSSNIRDVVFLPNVKDR